MTELFIGASASGKSLFAEERLCELASKNRLPKYYIATMQPFGEETMARIRKHKEQRQGKNMITIEQPLQIEDAVRKIDVSQTSKNAAVLVECMSNLLANEMFDEAAKYKSDNKQILSGILQGLGRIEEKCGNLLIVTNDVFSDGNTYDASTMAYIQLLGKLNCMLAQKADRVWEVICGIPVLRKGEPV